ncbi:MAG TPA: type III-B CRISPR module-associated Cmr3 family protein, partial [Pirellulales bacterium]|nr:type III-B CRISPR module-associated Cmr3 family protein [Pirellulales bacterium]
KSFGLVIEPLDVLFFRDGRPFGPSTRAGGGLPNPQTLWGALTTALLARHGCDFNALRDAVQSGADWSDAVVQAAGGEKRWIAHLHLRGPWLAGTSSGAPPAVAARSTDNGSASLEVFLPAPATLHAPKKHAAGPLAAVSPLAQPLPGWHVGQAVQPDAPQAGKPDLRLRPLWKRSAQPSEPARGFLTDRGQRAFRRGEDVDPDDLLKPEDLYEYDHRTGIEIDADRLTAAESRIYGARFLSLGRGVTFRYCTEGERYDVVFYAEAQLPSEAPAEPLAGIDLIAWGGEGRRARISVVNPAYEWPMALTGGDGKRPFLLLTTPGLFDDGWKPRCLDGLLVAAAVPERLPVSGWDLARGGPKPNRFAAPAGSVYFLDALPDNPPHSLSDGDLERRQGWGCYLQGVWTDA